MSDVAAGVTAPPIGSPTTTDQDSSASSARRAPLADAVQPVAHETRDRIITGFLTVVPFLMLGFVVWQLAGSWLHWSDLVVFGLIYIPTGLGITVGFHRLFTHRSFKTGPAVRAVMGALGSAAIEGPMISWVADHRKHHAFSDQEGDPHSPHVGHGDGLGGVLGGLWHAHTGWLLSEHGRADWKQYAPDLYEDQGMRRINRYFVPLVVLGLAIPALAGYLLTGTLLGAATGLLWGGLVRVFFVHHVTWSVNSVCHFLGSRRFDVED